MNGQVLKEYRVKANLSQRQLARQLNIPQSAISRIESGIFKTSKHIATLQTWLDDQIVNAEMWDSWATSYDLLYAESGGQYDGTGFAPAANAVEYPVKAIFKPAFDRKAILREIQREEKARSEEKEKILHARAAEEIAGKCNRLEKLYAAFNRPFKPIKPTEIKLLKISGDDHIPKYSATINGYNLVASLVLRDHCATSFGWLVSLDGIDKKLALKAA